MNTRVVNKNWTDTLRTDVLCNSINYDPEPELILLNIYMN